MQDRLGYRRALRARINHFHGRTRPAIAALLLALGAAPAGALPSIVVANSPSPTDQPALWVLSDSDTTIYLFGTFHALDDRTDWFARNIRAAFDSADELVLETIVPTDPADLFATLRRHSLTAPIVAGAPVVGAPVLAPAAGGASGSFTASAGRAMAAGRSVGLSFEKGADAVLRRIADAQGKPVDALESFDFQLAMFAALPAPAVAAPMAGRGAVQPDARTMLLDMRSAWKRGDASRFAAVLSNLEAQSPETYQRLFVDRNDDWARWIANRMDRPGTVFVAVGTGHLIGRDSVQRKLASRGFETKRID